MIKKGKDIVGATKYNETAKKRTEHTLADRVYNGIINRYSKHGNRFEFSDIFVWSGAVYVLPEIFGYILFFVMFYFLGGVILKYHGWERMFMFFMLLILWRINMMIKHVAKISKGVSSEKKY